MVFHDRVGKFERCGQGGVVWIIVCVCVCVCVRVRVRVCPKMYEVIADFTEEQSSPDDEEPEQPLSAKK